MQITLYSQQKKGSKSIVKDLFWYDTQTKQMLKFQGTRLQFNYDYKQKKAIPKPVTDKGISYGNNWNEINEWIKSQKQIEILSMAPQSSITIEVNDLDWYQTERELIEKSILYDIEEKINGRNKNTYRNS